MEDDKDIILDEKTRNMIMLLLGQLKQIEGQIDSILQVVVNTKFPNSEDKYELSDDLKTLKIVK